MTNNNRLFDRFFDGIRPPFLEDTTPPPFYDKTLTEARRRELDKQFVGSRSQAYYLKQFDRIDKAGRLLPSWHWAAFVSAFGWLLYRKRYLDCFVYCIAGVSFVKLNIVVLLAIIEFVFIGSLPKAWHWAVRGLVAIGVWLFWAAMVARWANAYYYRVARREIADALAQYPNDFSAQKAHLHRHGDVSLLGLATAFGLFALGVLVVGGQFMPLYVKKQEQHVIDGGYRMLISTKRQIANKPCPIGAVKSDHPTYHLQVVERTDGVPSDCAIVLSIANAHYLARHLNGHRLVLYRTDGERWHCQSSLGRQWLPVQCHN